MGRIEKRAMKIDFRNPGHLKICLLSQGVRIHSNALQGVGTEFTEKTYHFGNSDTGLTQQIGLPPVLLLPGINGKDDSVVGVHYRVSSPWEVKRTDNGEIKLFFADKPVTTVTYLQRPAYYGKKLSNGLLCETVLDFYTKNALGIFITGICLYWKLGRPCKFCSIGSTRKTVARAVPIITPELAIEAMKMVVKYSLNEVRYINYCSAAHDNFDEGFRELIDIIEGFKKTTEKKFIQHVVYHPPTNLDLFYKLKDTGVDTVTVCKEIINKKLFEKICPGKNSIYSHQKFYEALLRAVKAFGRGNAYCTLVAGLEPLDEMFEKLENLAEFGIVPSLNVFHPDKGSSFSQNPVVSIEFLFDMVNRTQHIFKKYHFKPELNGLVRNSLDGEVWRGYFD